MSGRGDAQWKIAFRLLAPMQPDEIIPYQVLCDAYDTDTGDLARVQRMVMRANKDLLAECGRQVVAVKDVGYRMLRAAEHSAQARRHERNSRRQLDQALVVVTATHLDELTPAQRERAVQHQFLLSQMCYALDEHENRLNEHNDLISGLQRSQAELEGKVDQLNRRLSSGGE